MRSRYGDLDDRKTDRKTSKIDRKSLKKARKKEKFPHSGWIYEVHKMHGMND